MSKFTTRMGLAPSIIGTAVRQANFGIEEYMQVAIDTACDINMVVESVGCESTKAILRNSIERLFLTNNEKTMGFGVGVESYTTSIIETGIGSENMVVNFFKSIWDAVVSFVKRLWEGVKSWFGMSSKSVETDAKSVSENKTKIEDSKREIVKESRAIAKKVDAVSVKNAKDNAKKEGDYARAPLMPKEILERAVAAESAKNKRNEQTAARIQAAAESKAANKPVTKETVERIVMERKEKAKAKLEDKVEVYSESLVDPVVEVITTPETHLDVSVIVPFTSNGYLACFDLDEVRDSSHMADIIRAGADLMTRDILQTSSELTRVLSARLNEFDIQLSHLVREDFADKRLNDLMELFSSPIKERITGLDLDNPVPRNFYTENITTFVEKTPEAVISSAQNANSHEVIGGITMFGYSNDLTAASALTFDTFFPTRPEFTSPRFLPSISQEDMEVLDRVRFDLMRDISERYSAASKEVSKFLKSVENAGNQIGKHLDRVSAAFTNPSDDLGKAKKLFAVTIGSRYISDRFGQLVVEELGEEAVLPRALVTTRRTTWDDLNSSDQNELLKSPHLNDFIRILDSNIQSLYDTEGVSFEAMRQGYNDLREFLSRDLTKVFTSINQDIVKIYNNTIRSVRFVVEDISNYVEANKKSLEDVEALMKDVSKAL